MTISSDDVAITTGDDHRYTLLARLPDAPSARLLWLPALGVAAKHYLPLAEALAARGVAVYLHEWRGNGSSSLRPDKQHDWGYKQLLVEDIASSHAQMNSATSASIPTIIGGHSLGGQLASCYLGLHAQDFQKLWLVASGTPHWRTFPAPRGWLLPFFYQFAIWLAHHRGAFPGRQLGFGGVEARSLICDWASVGLSGRYAAAGLDVDLQAAMAAAAPEVRGVLFKQDWLAPQASLAALLAKMPKAGKQVVALDSSTLGVRADHFAWMKQPGAVVDALLK